MSNGGGAWEYSSKGELAQNLIVNENNIPLKARRLSVITVEKATKQPLQYRPLSWQHSQHFGP